MSVVVLGTENTLVVSIKYIGRIWVLNQAKSGYNNHRFHFSGFQIFPEVNWSAITVSCSGLLSTHLSILKIWDGRSSNLGLNPLPLNTNPSGALLCLNIPQGVIKVVRCFSSSFRGTEWQPFQTSQAVFYRLRWYRPCKIEWTFWGMGLSSTMFG